MPSSDPHRQRDFDTSKLRTPRDVAGGGLLDRRLFLQRSVLLSAAAGPAIASGEIAEPWMRQPGRAFTNYGQPSPHESEVIRWISANAIVPGNGISWCPLQDLDGTITPNGLHYERHHNGVPDINPTMHKFVIHGHVDRALSFDIDTLLRYPRESRICIIECGGNSNAGWRRKPVQTAAGYAHGLVSCSEWTGVPVRLLLHEAGLRDAADWVIAEGADAFGMTISIPLAKLLDDALLALFQNGERIRPEQGYPLRLVAPGFEGVTNVKWLRTLRVSKQPVMARNETSRYTELQPSGKARMFTFTMGVKSLITHPSYGFHLPEPGFYEISGLAWSGSGRITRVEVSADGGASWADAALNAPVLPQSFTRFRIPWRWDGQPLVIQSRATDETGTVQPMRASLLAAHGRHGYFHYNAIVSWAINEQGYIKHVYVDDESTDGDDADPFNDEWDF